MTGCGNSPAGQKEPFMKTLKEQAQACQDLAERLQKMQAFFEQHTAAPGDEVRQEMEYRLGTALDEYLNVVQIVTTDFEVYRQDQELQDQHELALYRARRAQRPQP